MRRPPKSSTNKLSGESLRLVLLAQGELQAASRLEERQWEHVLDTALQKLLKAARQETIDVALDHLFKTEPHAYDILMDAVESVSESCSLEHDGVTYDCLLIAAPILAWTRYSINSGVIPEEARNTLSAQLHERVLAKDVRLALLPTLFSIDQLPRTHAETFALTQRLAQSVLKGTPLKCPTNLPETATFLADTRYLIGVVSTEKGGPLFQWQANAQPAERKQSAERWRAQAGPTVLSLLPGCGAETLMPEAYYVACREADRQIRPVSVRAAIHYLTNALGVEAGDLRAIIGAFSEHSISDRVHEYRIGFTLRQNPEVIYGVIWPLYDQEDDAHESSVSFESLSAPESVEKTQRTQLEEITALLRSCGMTHIKQHNERFPLEFCEDCGAPLYPDAAAELVHAEMPDDISGGNVHLH